MNFPTQNKKTRTTISHCIHEHLVRLPSYISAKKGKIIKVAS